jgi:hypothetical protein
MVGEKHRRRQLLNWRPSRQRLSSRRRSQELTEIARMTMGQGARSF